jgi:hypothetical protein
MPACLARSRRVVAFSADADEAHGLVKDAESVSLWAT